MKRAATQTLRETGEDARSSWAERYREVRAATLRLVAPLALEDFGVAATADVSPPKWHLGHTTWFFERFILARWEPGFRPLHPAFDYAFNSYYQTIGAFVPKTERALLSRPTCEEVRVYRAMVDERVMALLERVGGEDAVAMLATLEIGLHHEQQHQELLLMDIKRNFFANPLRPAYRQDAPPALSEVLRPAPWIHFEGGLTTIGAGEGFAYDNERGQHQVWLEPFELAAELVTNAEYLEFMADEGYENPALWLADGWEWRRDVRAPLYWERTTSGWQVMTLYGMRALHPAEPVAHLSYYEAQAFARWRGARLPTEFEWEHAARTEPVSGQFAESEIFHPVPTRSSPAVRRLEGIHGSLWEWTQSAYLPYPRYLAYEEEMAEYNSKFFCNQFVLRGGSCVTPRPHYRSTYRNFYYPHMRWAFTGLRLAKDCRCV